LVIGIIEKPLYNQFSVLHWYHLKKMG
jgi:hypothetical protein